MKDTDRAVAVAVAVINSCLLAVLCNIILPARSRMIRSVSDRESCPASYLRTSVSPTFSLFPRIPSLCRLFQQELMVDAPLLCSNQSTTMTRPVDIPGSSRSTDSGDSSRVVPTAAPATAALRQRGHTFAYPRAEANGNAHHLPPDAHMRGSSASARTSNVGASSSSSPGSAILNLLGLSPRS